MKACIVYKTVKGEYKIVAQSETAAGYLLHVTPVYILSIDCPDEIFLKTILCALDYSSESIRAPDRSEFPLIQKNLLTQLKEKSFSRLYANSTSCEIRIEGNTMTVYPNRLISQDPKEGLVWKKEDKATIEDFERHHEIIISTVKSKLNPFM
jgi:hypothetical protein